MPTLEGDHAAFLLRLDARRAHGELTLDEMMEAAKFVGMAARKLADECSRLVFGGKLFDKRHEAVLGLCLAASIAEDGE